MRKIKVENFVSKLVLVFLILWGAASFFVFLTPPIFQWAFIIISLIAIILALIEHSGYLVLIVITLFNSYFAYGLLFAYGPPLWVILIGLAITLGLAFWILRKQLVPQSENFLLVLTFYLISMLEIYLSLSFWLINPMTKSLIMGIFAYMITGYLSNISEESGIDKKFSTYIYTTIVVLTILIFTVSWGR